ncbi:MAG TPA: SH3 domain-containing protein [Candidatus Acidoferrum sp.]|nr:SH3 domain-containing protein [Candidatus Acidoferrum sp.]
MKMRAPHLRVLMPSALALFLSAWITAMVCGQAVPYARTFPKSKEEVEAALKEMQAYAGQKLPIVDGFVAVGDQPLSRYERAFYQFSIDLLPDAPGATIVRVTAKITAWYADRDPSKSGYQVLPSNGRLELDLLDRLTERLGGKVSTKRSLLQAPKPKLELSGAPSITSLPSAAATTAVAPKGSSATSGADEVNGLRTKRESEEKRMQQLSGELQSLQEIQRNQAHPRNLVVVKKSGTPILAKPALASRVLFTAAADDEFELLDADGEWIHVQISGASRGYIRRSSLELPELLAARLKSPNVTPFDEKEEAFRVTREETGSFPGHWASLQGKPVKIYTVQPISADSKETRATAKLDYAASLFQKFSRASATSSDSIEGVVIIFDSADGGIIANTLSSVQEFASGSLSREAFWKRCYADPPDAFQ